MTEKAEIIKILKSLRQSVNDIEGCSVVSNDGLVIASELMSDTESKSFAALSADMSSAGSVVASELKIGQLSEITIASSQANLISTGIGKKAILVCLAQKKANIGLVLLHMKRAAHRLSRLIN